MQREKLSTRKRLLNPMRGICCGIFAATIAMVSQARSADQLVPYEAASKNGLQRAWFSQVRVDPTRNYVISWTLDNDLLFALTSTGTIHALDSETGKTRWVTQAGKPDRPSIGLGANSAFVAVLNGSRLYVLDRSDGHLIWSRPVGNVSEAAPALSENYVYVVQISGRVEGFQLDDPATAVWQYQSTGHLYPTPLVTEEFLIWTTDRGQLYFCNAIRPRILFRVETHDELVSAPVAQGANLYATSLGGYLYCYTKSTGDELWRFSSGMPITKKPTVVRDRAYVASEAPALYAIDSTSGRHLWAADTVVQFVAQGANRVYGVDRFGALLILDSESGTLAGRLVTGAGLAALVNDQSDRIFLVSDSGLVQCLHELGASEPTLYGELASEEEPQEEAEGDTEESVDQPALDATEEEPVDEDDNPFG